MDVDYVEIQCEVWQYIHRKKGPVSSQPPAGAALVTAQPAENGHFCTHLHKPLPPTGYRCRSTWEGRVQRK